MENRNKISIKPDKILPRPLLECIEGIFEQKIEGTALVGGTALAGYYAGHRRSDDIDLFAKDETAFKAAVLAARSLAKRGVEFSQESLSAQYFHAIASFQQHSFTVDIVLDENLFQIGKFQFFGKNIQVASLETLFRMKIATLVSRAGEKDLYDVKWLFENTPLLEVEEWVALGQSIDKGVSAENLLASLAGTKLRKEACGFSLDPKKKEDHVFKEIREFQKKLIQDLTHYLKGLPTPPLGKAVKKLSR